MSVDRPNNDKIFAYKSISGIDPLSEAHGDANDQSFEPTTRQEGGSHYQGSIQPIEFIMANNLSFCQGNVIKYVFRYKDKNGLEDLKKAKHYIDFMIKELENDQRKTT